jgi:hypothetical protein
VICEKKKRVISLKGISRVMTLFCERKKRFSEKNRNMNRVFRKNERMKARE